MRRGICRDDDQLGLKLEPKKVLGGLVIDHVENPDSQSEAASSKLAFNSLGHAEQVRHSGPHMNVPVGPIIRHNARLISTIYFANN